MPPPQARLPTLPEELLLKIMHNLDPPSLQCLRRTNRTFLRLFCDASFSHFHHDAATQAIYAARFPWYQGSSEFENAAYGGGAGAGAGTGDEPCDFKYLMHFDSTRGMCATCRKAQVGGYPMGWELSREYLLCTGCLVDHPKLFFEEGERKYDGDVRKGNGRKCIGCTGYIRLCEHEVITKEDVAGLWGEVRGLVVGKGKQHVWVRGCRHPSHAPEGWHEGLGKEAVERTYPTAVLRREGRAVVLDLAWTGHVRACQSNASVEGMERCIAALRRGAAEYIVPQAVPGMVPEMRCFDPNRCACLDWGDKFPSNSKWACMPAWSGGDGCRGDVRHRLFSPSGDGSSSSDAETSTGEAHVAVSGLGNTFGEESRSSVSVTRCADMKRCIRFDYHRRIACSPVWQYDAFTTVDYSWLEAIDPDSYGLWKDKDTKGTLWCSTSSCPNYYRYLERPLVRSCCMAKGAIFKDSSGVKDPPFWIIDGNVYKLTNGTLLLINNKQFVLRVNNALPAKRQPAVSKTPSKPALPSARKPAPKPLSAPQSRRPRKNTKPSTWRKLTNLFRDNPQ